MRPFFYALNLWIKGEMFESSFRKCANCQQVIHVSEWQTHMEWLCPIIKEDLVTNLYQDLDRWERIEPEAESN